MEQNQTTKLGDLNNACWYTWPQLLHYVSMVLLHSLTSLDNSIASTIGTDWLIVSPHMVSFDWLFSIWERVVSRQTIQLPLRSQPTQRRAT